MTLAPAYRLRRRPGWFRPVPLRSRADGWTIPRQCGFLAALYLTGSVSAAAREVGMSRASAYRLRERRGAESFAHAWDRVLMAPGSGHAGKVTEDFRKVTDGTLLARLDTGLVRPVVFLGAMTGIARKADHAALFRLLRRHANASDRALATGGAG